MRHLSDIWATSWQNQQNGMCTQQRLRSAWASIQRYSHVWYQMESHPPSLIRVCAVHMKKTWVLSYPLSAQPRLWSDWADAQAELNLRWEHSHFVGFVMRWSVITMQQIKSWAINLTIWCLEKKGVYCFYFFIWYFVMYDIFIQGNNVYDLTGMLLVVPSPYHS